MWTRLFIFVLFDYNLSHAFSERCLDSIKMHITENIKPHQVTFFVTNMEDKHLPTTTEVVFQAISRDIPSVIIDFRNSSLLGFSATRHVSLNVILYNGFDSVHKNQLDDLRHLIDCLEKSSPKSMKPKTLVMISEEIALPEDVVKIMFEHAWLNKFLDFSLIREYFNDTLNENECVLQYYNPFYKSTTKITFATHVRLFPDKLHNVNGYEFEAAIISIDAYSNVVRNEKKMLQLSKG